MSISEKLLSTFLFLRNVVVVEYSGSRGCLHFGGSAFDGNQPESPRLIAELLSLSLSRITSAIRPDSPGTSLPPPTHLYSRTPQFSIYDRVLRPASITSLTLQSQDRLTLQDK
jgi:hypothetical protein